MPAIRPVQSTRGRPARKGAEAHTRFGPRSKTVVSASERKKALEKHRASLRQPAARKNPRVRVKAVALDATRIKEIAAVLGAGPSPTAARRFTPEELFGTIFAVVSAYNVGRAEKDFSQRKKTLNPADAEKLWSRFVSSVDLAMKLAGAPKIRTQHLSKWSHDIFKAAGARKAIEEALDRASDQKTIALTATTSVTATIAVGASGAKIFDDESSLAVRVRMCRDQEIPGTITSHVDKAVPIPVVVAYVCVDWDDFWNPVKLCYATLWITGRLTFHLGIDYRIRCCQLSVSGSGTAQACVSFAGVSICAGCRVWVSGVSSLSSSTEQDGTCRYSSAVSVTTECSVAGLTVLSVTDAVALDVIAVCPPGGPC